MILTKSKIYEIRLITLEFVDKNFRECYRKTNHEYGLYYVSREGYVKLVHFLVSKGDWNRGITDAAEAGHKKLVDYYILRGSCKWEFSMIHAAIEGRINLVQFFISKGAHEYDLGMLYASQGKHKKLVKYFRNKLEGK